ncbi:MAG: 30S ribosomal protein S4 [Candidatus Diapherotrites archaeon]|nr:30S ribosomal protein S4 [Candidatus Diapherotrites archaeon]
MGDPKKTKKQYRRPVQIWDTASLEKERELRNTYGFKSKRELWKVETILRKKRKSARALLALPLEKRLKKEKELLDSLARLGLLDSKATLEDVLTLSVQSLMERRLQTLVWRKGLANSMKQARQFITHGHIAIGGGRVTAPSYLVLVSEEGKMGYYAGKKMELQHKQPPKKKARPGDEEGPAAGEASAPPIEGAEEIAAEGENAAEAMVASKAAQAGAGMADEEDAAGATDGKSAAEGAEDKAKGAKGGAE